jgi:pseudaminic acid cytidylyltransferase
MNIAIIPARGGSKRIPKKNIKLFYGRPMIAYAITSAFDSGLFAHVIVSTDDDEIAEVARNHGAETPFTRPAKLSNDHAPTVPVIAHAIEACKNLGWSFEYACCIYPSVPLINMEDLKGSLNELRRSGADYCFPVTQFPSAIQRALLRDSDGRMSPFFPENEHVRTQDLDTTYHDAGQFYWGRAKAWLTNAQVHSGGVGYVIPSWRVVDIDTSEDWRRAEIIYSALQVK